MKTRIILLTCMMAISTMAMAQKLYQMDVEMKDGTITRYIMSNVRDVKYDGKKTIINLKGTNTYTQKIYNDADIASISWDEYQGWISPTGTGQFAIDEQHLAVVTPDYSVAFDAPCIDGDKTLAVSMKYNMKPLEIGSDINIKPVVAYDFDLNGQHELTATAEIRLPIRPGLGETPIAAYYNNNTQQWEPVNYYYDAGMGELVIKTSHLSTYAGFSISNEHTRNAKLIFLYHSPTDYVLDIIAEKLAKICDSDDPLAVAIENYGSQYSELSQIGLDIGFNAIQSLGFGSEMLESFAEVLGHVGVALSVYQICRNNYQGDKAQLAGNTMKLCLTQVNYWASHYFGNSILSASMASVAMLDYAINKFATEAWTGRKDLYKKGYDLYYARGSRGYRNAVDWFNELWPLFKRKDLNEQQLNEAVDNKVNSYVREFWQSDIMNEYYTLANNGVSWTYLGGLNQDLMDELSNEHRGNLYNGTLVSVVCAIKNRLENEAWEKADEEMEKYTRELNKVCMLTFMDSGLEDGKSAYAGCIVRFKNLSEKVKDPELWQTTLNNEGKGSFQFRVFAMYDAEVKPIVEIIDKEGMPILEIELSNLKAGYIREKGENIIDINDYAENEVVVDDGYTIQMIPDFTHVDFKMGGMYGGSFVQHNEANEKDGIYFETWYGDIKQAINNHKKNVKPDLTGGIRYVAPDSVLVMIGAFNSENRTGSGTFKMRVSYENVEQTDEQFMNVFTSTSIWLDYMKEHEAAYNVLLDGEIEHRIDGTFTVSYTDGKYVYTLKGTGTYKLEANACSELHNPKCLPVDIYSDPIQIIRTEVPCEGRVNMDYKFRVKK